MLKRNWWEEETKKERKNTFPTIYGFFSHFKLQLTCLCPRGIFVSNTFDAIKTQINNMMLITQHKPKMCYKYSSVFLINVRLESLNESIWMSKFHIKREKIWNIQKKKLEISRKKKKKKRRRSFKWVEGYFNKFSVMNRNKIYNAVINMKTSFVHGIFVVILRNSN